MFLTIKKSFFWKPLVAEKWKKISENQAEGLWVEYRICLLRNKTYRYGNVLHGIDPMQLYVSQTEYLKCLMKSLRSCINTRLSLLIVKVLDIQLNKKL